MMCPCCHSPALRARQYRCECCGLDVGGRFETPALYRLTGEQARLAECLALCGGNLKAACRELGVSYPTLRKRVGRLVETMRQLKAEDNRKAGEIRAGMERGEITEEEGLRRIVELSYGG